MPEIYAMTASALEIWVILNEYKLAKFIPRGSFRWISSPFRRPKYKNIPGSTPLDPLERFNQDLVFATPLSWMPTCFGALQVFLVQSLWTAFFPAISHDRHRHRLKLYPRTEKAGSKMVGKSSFVYFRSKHIARYEFRIVFVRFSKLIESYF